MGSSFEMYIEQREVGIEDRFLIPFDLRSPHPPLLGRVLSCSRTFILDTIH